MIIKLILPNNQLSRTNEECGIFQQFLKRGSNFNSKDRSDFIPFNKSRLINTTNSGEILTNTYEMLSGLKFQYIKKTTAPIIETVHVPIYNDGRNTGYYEFKQFFINSNEYSYSTEAKEEIFESRVQAFSYSNLKFIDNLDPEFPVKTTHSINFHNPVRPFIVSSAGINYGITQIRVAFKNLNRDTSLISITVVNESFATRDELINSIKRAYQESGLKVDLETDRATLVIRFLDNDMVRIMELVYPTYRNPQKHNTEDYIAARNWIMRNRDNVLQNLKNQGNDELKYYIAAGFKDIKYKIGNFDLCHINIY